MPATAGRVRMPANNRVHSSAALQTHGIWQSAIGYDPYAPANKEAKPGKGSVPDSESDNAYASFQGLLALARVTSGANSDETRGACRKCGRVGHLTYQCRNFLSLKEEDRDRNDDSALRTAEEVFKKIKNSVESDRGQEEREEEEEESSSSDSYSDVDPEIERIIAKRYGWKISKKVSLDGKKRSRMKSRESLSSSNDEEERRKRRRRRQKRRNRDRQRDSGSESSGESDRHRKRRRRRRREESSSGLESSEPSSNEEEWRERKRRRAEKKSRGRHLRQKD